MNRYILIRRLTGPAVLLLLGIVALLNQAHIVGWGVFIPLLLILIGVLKLAERAALANEPFPPGGSYPAGPYTGPYAGPYSGGPYSGAPYPGTQYSGTVDPNAPPHSGSSTSIVAVRPHEFGKDPEGGES